MRLTRHYILLITLLIVALSLISSRIALSHPWTTSDVIVWDEGSSSYSAKGRLFSSEKYDFHGLMLTVKRYNEYGPIVVSASASCGEINEGCGNRSYSPTVNFPQSKHYIFSQHCAFDGSHHIHPWSHGQYAGACSGHNVDLNRLTVY